MVSKLRDTEGNTLSDTGVLNTNQQWADVSGDGRPDDYATIGTPSGSYVGTTPAELVEEYANNPAGRINDGRTNIEAGKITIFGSTTLSDWRSGGDVTKIDGGSISANSITANKLTIGSRGIVFEGVSFSVDKQTNNVSWTAGVVAYTNDLDTSRTLPISPGSLSCSSGTYYFYWEKDSTNILSTQDRAVAFGADTIAVATYAVVGQVLIVTYGKTIVDGSDITAGTITGDRIVANTITASQLSTGELITATAQIKNSVITSAHIAELDAAKIKSGTLDAERIGTESIVIGKLSADTQTAIGKGETAYNDPAARINAVNTTKIDPGKILISGSTTLSDWRHGSDSTKIDGGNIYANSITANKLAIGSRNISFDGLSFTVNKTNNTVSWTAGTVSYVDDLNVVTSKAIASGSQSCTSGTYYFYWIKGGTALTVTTTRATAFGVDNLVVASYGVSGKTLVVSYGKTIVDGSDITTGTINADRIVGYSITSSQLSTGELITAAAQIKNSVITSAHIAELDAAKIKSGTLDAGRIGAGSLVVSKLQDSSGNTLSDSTVLNANQQWGEITGAGKPADYATTGKSLGLPFELWNLGEHSVVDVGTGGKVGTTALEITTSGGYPNQGNYVPVDSTKLYRVRMWAKPSTYCDGKLYSTLRQFKEPGVPCDVNGGRSPYFPAGVTRSTHESNFGVGAWGEYTFVYTAFSFQTGVKYVQPEFLNNYGGTVGYWHVQGFELEEVTEVQEAATTAVWTKVSGAGKPANGATVGAPSGTMVGGTLAENIETYANNPAARINTESTTIDPGKIKISGATTLNDWRTPNTTEIDGGKISTNSIEANKIIIGSRGVSFDGVAFSVNKATNVVSWTAGTVSYIDDANTSASAAITSGSSACSSGTYYFYWVKGATTISATSIRSTAYNTTTGNNVVVATYVVSSKALAVNFGKTIIDGSDISTRTVTADKIATYSITATELSTGQLITSSAQIKDAIITSAKITDLSADKITTGSITSSVIYVGDTSTGKFAWLDGASTRLGFWDGTRSRVHIGNIDGTNYGIQIWDANGNPFFRTDAAGGGIIANRITSGTIGAGVIYAGTLSANQVNASGFTATSANIGDAAVTTLKIGGNAVTVTAASTGNSWAATGDWVMHNMCSVNVDLRSLSSTETVPIMLKGHALFNHQYWTLELWYTKDGGAEQFAYGYATQTAYTGTGEFKLISYRVNLVAGSLYNFRLYAGTASGYYIHLPYIEAMGCKR